ncbi:MAG TPA: LamG domain-containing protein [Chloroflexota bacterium]
MAFTDSLIEWWKLENANASHSTNNLTATGTPTYGAGKKNNAVSVTGTQKLSIADNAALSTGNIDFTLCAWVNLANTTATDRWAVSKDNTAGDREYYLAYRGSLARFQFGVGTGASPGTVRTVTANTFGAPSATTWYFIVCWHDAAADTLNIQVNDGTVDSAGSTGASPLDGASDFCIGGRHASSSAWWNGQVDEVAFWKRTLTAAERTTLYNGGAGLTYEDLPKEILPASIASGEAFGTPTLVAIVAPTSIASGEAFGLPLIGEGLQVRTVGIPSEEAVGTPQVQPAAAVIAPSSIASGEAFGAPQVVSTHLYPVGIGSEEAFGSASVTLAFGALISPTGIPSAAAFGTPSVSTPQVIAPVSIASAEAFGFARLSLGTLTGLGFPQVTVEIAFGTDPLAPPVWLDVTPAVQAFSITRGRQHPLDRVEAGTAQIVLDNRNRWFDPTNAGSPYWPNVVPRRRVQIRATHGTTRPLFTGYVESWPQEQRTVGDATVTVSCTDAFLYFTKASITTDVPYHDSTLRTEEAVGWVLDHVDWPVSVRDIWEGVFHVDLVVDATSVPLTLLQDMATAEGGSIYLTADGRVRFTGYNTPFAAAYASSVATFGDGPGELPYRAAIPLYDEGHLWNQVVITATGLQPPGPVTGAPLPESEIVVVDQRVQVDDPDSQARYFVSQLALSLPLVSRMDAQSLAGAYLEQYKTPRLYIGTLELEWSGEDAVMAQMLDRELLDRITVIRRPMGGGSPLTGDYHIERIQHHMEATGIWETTWDLAPVPSGGPLVPGVLIPAQTTFSLAERLVLVEKLAKPVMA